MGGGASTAAVMGTAEQLDLEAVKALAGSDWDDTFEQQFKDAADETGKITKKQFEDVKEQHDSATKIQARARGRRERRNPLMSAESSGDKDITTRITDIYAKFDRDGNGKVDYSEVTYHLGSSSVAKGFMEDLDKIEKDGCISLEEWQKFFADMGDAANAAVTHLEGVSSAPVGDHKAATSIQAINRGRRARGRGIVAVESSGKDFDTRLKESFTKFDRDGSDEIDLEELRFYLTAEQGTAMLKDLDTINSDKKVQWDEWQKYFNNLEAKEASLSYLESIIVTGTASEHNAATAIQSRVRGSNTRAQADSASADTAVPADTAVQASAPASEETKAEPEESKEPQ